MPKSKNHQRKQHQRSNSAGGPQVSNKRTTYHGNARFVELGSPGILFRQLVNVDQITNLRLEERFEEDVIIGYDVIVSFNNNNNQIGFRDAGQAAALYNVLLDQINAVGAPMTRLPRVEVPQEPSAIVGADGLAVDAADLHPDLAGGEGAGVAPNDDDLTDEDLAMLEHPDIDEDAIADAFDATDLEPEEPQAH